MRVPVEISQTFEVDVPLSDIVADVIGAFNGHGPTDPRYRLTELINAALGWMIRLSDEQIASLTPGQRKIVWDFLRTELPRWSKDHLT